MCAQKKRGRNRCKGSAGRGLPDTFPPEIGVCVCARGVQFRKKCRQKGEKNDGFKILDWERQ